MRLIAKYQGKNTMQSTGSRENKERVRSTVIKAPIDVLTWSDAIGRISTWAANRESRYVCITNAHSVVTGWRESAFGRVLDGADMVTPDGAPVAWMLRRLGNQGQVRINGPDLMWRYFEHAAANQEAIYLYGGTEETLEELLAVLAERIPNLRIAGAYSPPFRPLTPQEDAAAVQAINASGAGTVWVSLGCPNQERWMAEHRGRVHAVMIGVGAAFDYHAETIQRAPTWMQHSGLEWLHRLCSEPRRLWKRYLVTNTLFIIGAGLQLVRRTR
jgi:N-acetylglucosaminyldiphosphoundecaprenol N-acetyl-beta-D-mannosaminyltransferase